MICPKCKNEMPDGSKFCQYCGTSFGLRGNIQIQPEQSQKSKRRNGWRITAIILAVALLISVMTYAFSFSKTGITLFGVEVKSTIKMQDDQSDQGMFVASLGDYPVLTCSYLTSQRTDSLVGSTVIVDCWIASFDDSVNKEDHRIIFYSNQEDAKTDYMEYLQLVRYVYADLDDVAYSQLRAYFTKESHVRIECVVKSISTRVGVEIKHIKYA